MLALLVALPPVQLSDEWQSGWGPRLAVKRLGVRTPPRLIFRGDDGDGGEVGRERWGNPSSKKMQFPIDFLHPEVIIIGHLLCSVLSGEGADRVC